MPQTVVARPAGSITQSTPPMFSEWYRRLAKRRFAQVCATRRGDAVGKTCGQGEGGNGGDNARFFMEMASIETKKP